MRDTHGFIGLGIKTSGEGGSYYDLTLGHYNGPHHVEVHMQGAPGS